MGRPDVKQKVHRDYAGPKKLPIIHIGWNKYNIWYAIKDFDKYAVYSSIAATY